MFLAYLVVAGVLVITRFGEGRWFFLDEWAFLSNRSITDIGDLFRPHNEHLVAVPVVVYRVLFRLFGLESYIPYQIAIVATHGIAVILLRLVMRRAGVGPWMASAVASTLVLFGPGAENIVWGFQIGFVGAFAFGLGQLLLSDHDATPMRRDALAVVCGVCAVLTVSSVGVAMVAVTGAAVLARRGWRAACWQMGPPLALFGLWWVTARPSNVGLGAFEAAANETSPRSDRLLALEVADWNVRSVAHTFEALGSHTIVAVLLGALLLGGTVAALRDQGLDGARRTLAAPMALALGALAFTTLTGLARWKLGPSAAEAERYTYVMVAFLLPQLAVATAAVARRWTPLGPIAIAGFVLVSAGNLSDFDDSQRFMAGIGEISRSQVATWAESPYATVVPESLTPSPLFYPEMTIGWLVTRHQNGDLAGAEPVPELAMALPLHLGIDQTEGAVDGDCEPLDSPVTFPLDLGEAFEIRSRQGVAVSMRAGVGDAVTGVPQSIWTGLGDRFEATIPHLVVEVAPGLTKTDAVAICRS